MHHVRIIVFSDWPEARLVPWISFLEGRGSATEVRVVRLSGRTSSLPHLGDNTPRPDSLAGIRAWRPEAGVALGAPLLTPSMFTIPIKGTLLVRVGHGAEVPRKQPGFWELWHHQPEVEVAVQWLSVGAFGFGSCATAPVYPHDSPRNVAERAEELGRLLLSECLDRLQLGDAPGDTRIQPPAIAPGPTAGQRAILWMRLTGRRLRRLLTPRMSVKYAAVLVWLSILRPLRDRLRTLRGGHPVRVFTLHRVTSLCRDGMTISPAAFRKQLEYVKRHHDVIPLDRAMQLVAKGERLRRPAAAITFDDGYASVDQHARPIMASLGIPGTCFVCPGVVDTDGRYQHDQESPVRYWLNVMGWDSIAALRDAGWSIGSHSVTHARLSALERDDLERELRESRDALRERLGEERLSIAYPFGGTDDITAEGVEAAKACGYTGLFSDFGGENVPGQSDTFFLRRTDIGGDHDAMMWKAMVHGLDLQKWGRRIA